MRSDNTFGVKFENISSNLFHNVINKKIAIELLLQDKNFVFDENAVVVVEVDNFIVLIQNY